MIKRIYYLLLVLVLISTFVFGLANGVLAGGKLFRAVLEPDDDSEVEAKVVLIDNGQRIEVSGVAKYMDRNKIYVSIVNNGPDCRGEPVQILGSWKVDRNGRGQLKVLLDPSESKLDPSEIDLEEFDSISVRSFDDDGDLVLESCGEILE